MVRNLENLLLQIHRQEMQEQKKILDQALAHWLEEGNEKQIDDILLIGVKI